MIVVVPELLGEDLLEMEPAEDEAPIEALSADDSDETLGEGVRSGRRHWGLDDPHTFRADDFVKAGGELRVPIAE